MGNDKNTLIPHGQIEYIESTHGNSLSNEVGGWRVKIRLDSDGPEKATADLPWAFPLLPKTLQSVPKIGEGAFVLTARLGDATSQRYYIGPIISQPQFQEYSSYNKAKGNAVSLLSGAKTTREDPLTSIDRSAQLTKGAFPNLQDVALIGRGQEDIILKYRGSRDGKEPTSEINLRAGIRMQPATTNVKYLKGNVAFNAEDPSYIQIKYKKSGIAGLGSGAMDNDVNRYEGPEKRTANGIVNVVADKINLISHQDPNLNNSDLGNNEELIDEKKIDDIMSRLHRTVYGDELVILLKYMLQAITTHTHPYSMLPPTITGTDLEEIQNYNLEKILSPNVRIS